MTTLRRLAVWTSEVVVRLASPGAKEWAQATARELDAIPNDWASLRWALGSTRVLLDPRPSPLTSLDEVPAETQKLIDRVHWQAGFFLAMSTLYELQAISYLWRFFETRSTLEWAGCAIVILSSILVGIYSLMERHRLNVPWYDDIYDDPVACAHLYKERLKRFDSLWIYIPSLTCTGWMGSLVYYGGESYDSLDMVCIGVLVSMFLFILLVMRQRKQNALRRIDELNALVAECGAGGL